MDNERMKKLAGILKEGEEKKKEEFIIYEFDNDIEINDKASELYNPLKDNREEDTHGT